MTNANPTIPTGEDGEHQRRYSRIWSVLSALIAVIGLLLITGGLWLTIHGGRDYCLLSGAYIIAAVLLWRRESEATWLAVIILAVTIWIQLL